MCFSPNTGETWTCCQMSRCRQMWRCWGSPRLASCEEMPCCCAAWHVCRRAYASLHASHVHVLTTAHEDLPGFAPQLSLALPLNFPWLCPLTVPGFSLHSYAKSYSHYFLGLSARRPSDTPSEMRTVRWACLPDVMNLSKAILP